MLIVAHAAPQARDAYCERLVSAMRSLEPLLSDWGAYTELLLADATLDDDQYVQVESCFSPSSNAPEPVLSLSH